MNISSATVILFVALLPSLACAETAARQTFAIETYVGRAYNYLDNMADKEGMPYFDIFWTEPAVAGHHAGVDAPDVVSRAWEGSIMARHMTGRKCRNEDLYAKNTLSFLTPETGLVVPGTGFVGFAQGVSLHALTTAYADGKDTAFLDLMRKTVDHLPGTFNNRDQWRAVPIKSLMNCARLANYQPAVEYAGKLIRGNPLFKPNNKKFGSHMHAGLRTLVGAADYALYVKDIKLLDQVDAIYRNIRAFPGARFGYLPEMVYRPDDLVGCETCALMDYIGLAATLANNGHPEYWGDVERVVRNQLTESQVVDATWLKPGDQPDTAVYTWRDVGSRMVGGFAGWSSPTHLLAYREGWAPHAPKTRAFKNCCGGSGVHAYFIAWKNAARYECGTLSVNMHIDKLLPQAEIRCHQPYRGYLSIALKQACKVRVRIPDFTGAKAVVVRSNLGPVQAVAEGGYLELGAHPAGAKLETTYPVPLKEEQIAIGNPGRRQYHYRVMWKGDTVVRVTPIGQQYQASFSDTMKKDVEVFYGENGPGRLYQREYMLRDVTPISAPLHVDDGTLDFWLLRDGGAADSRTGTTPVRS